MLSNFALMHLAQAYKTDLIRYQLYAARPALLGLVEQYHCFDEHGLYGLLNGKGGSGNFSSGLRAYVQYKSKFKSYLEAQVALGDLPIYRDKLEFMRLLFINGQYGFLNLVNTGGADHTYQLIDGEIVIMSRFDKAGLPTESRTRRETLTRIQKGEVIRFYSRDLPCAESGWSDSSCFLTMSAEDIAGSEFVDLFRASRFLEEEDPEAPTMLVMHDFLCRLVEAGKRYDELNPTESEAREVSDINRFFKGSGHNRGFVVMTEFGEEICDSRTSSIAISQSVGDKMLIDGLLYVVVKLTTDNANVIVITVKPVTAED